MICVISEVRNDIICIFDVQCNCLTLEMKSLIVFFVIGIVNTEIICIYSVYCNCRS